MSQNEFTEFRKKIIYLLGFHVKSKKTHIVALWVWISGRQDVE